MIAACRATIHDIFHAREGEESKEFYGRLAKTALKVGGFAVAAIAGLGVLYTLKYTLPLLMIPTSPGASAWEIAVISSQNAKISDTLLAVTCLVAIIPAAGWGYFVHVNKI